jgi:hypothetical protein
VSVTQVFLDLADVDAAKQEVRGEAVPQRVYRHGLQDACPGRGPLDSLLDDGVTHVMASDDAGARIGRQVLARE